MGKTKELKKMRKYWRQNADRVSQEFKEGFKIEDYLRPKPRIVPKKFWDWFLRFIIKQG